MNWLHATTALFWLSLRRLAWSMTTLMVFFPLAGCALFLFRFQRRLNRVPFDFDRAFERYSEVFVLVIFASILLPLCTLAYATTSVGGEREERTLVFLLVRPIPRWLILFAKFCATLPLVLILLMGSFYGYCQIAGPVGHKAFAMYAPVLALMITAYVSLFHLFSVMFRHATIVALIYALVMESFIGNMPGIIKRVAVSFYGRSTMYELGAPYGIEAPKYFESISVAAANATLWAVTLGGLLLAMIIFSRREYRDLT